MTGLMTGPSGGTRMALENEPAADETAPPVEPAISLNLEDGARADLSQFPPKPPQDLTTTSLLEQLEDLMDSEVGDTPLLRTRNLERQLNVRQLYLKFEGWNPSGTQKDRIAFGQVFDALRRGFDCVSLATCGNFGVACALACRQAGLRCRISIPAAYHTRRIREMEQLGAEVHRVGGDYEQAVHQSSQEADRMGCYDANPGGANTALQILLYGQIAYEIYDVLRDAPRVVAVPVSNGTTLAGVARGFQSLFRRGKTSRIPYMVAGSSYRKNPIIQAFLKKRTACEDLPQRRIRETPINEPLINWHAIDGDQALEAIRSTSGWAVDATDRRMRSLTRIIREQEGIHVVPASTSALQALCTPPEGVELINDRFVVVITGKGS